MNLNLNNILLWVIPKVLRGVGLVALEPCGARELILVDEGLRRRSFYTVHYPRLKPGIMNL